MTENNRLYISDFGLVNALGMTKADVLANMVKGSRRGIVPDHNLHYEETVYVGKVSGDLPALNHCVKAFQTRNNQLAKAALVQIDAEIQNLIACFGASRIGVIVGTSTSGIAEGEGAVIHANLHDKFPEKFDYKQQEMGNLAQFISDECGITGPAWTISTACSSSAKAFVTAQELIDAGVIDAAIVGGVDSLCKMTINGFYALDSTAKSFCQPSSKNRDGINIGEAAALAVLRKDKGEIFLAGCGESSDAHHMSAPHPQGLGAIASMTLALNKAGLSSKDIGYINLHGTATPKNDEMEAIAVSNVFGGNTPSSSSKAMIGHTLGAAGATEIGLCWLMLQDPEYRLIPHVWDQVEDPEIAKLSLVNMGETKRVNYCLSNSFAFGGNNVSLIIGKA